MLVVEDEADTRDFLASVLRDQGAVVTTAASVHEALATVEQRICQNCYFRYCDARGKRLRVPAKITKSWSRPHGRARRPAIAVTAYAREEDRKLVLDAGFELHISKPFEPPKPCCGNC